MISLKLSIYTSNEEFTATGCCIWLGLFLNLLVAATNSLYKSLWSVFNVAIGQRICVQTKWKIMTTS